ncbi:hypothetical protein B0H10DRAFT_2197531 [Mycena sp. CBHHK59/15]|nr:hypothetical protein B0H10DRAFT_2197531 [Mycena sp. CBHHK59/15]
MIPSETFLATKTVHDELQLCRLQNPASGPSSMPVKNRTRPTTRRTVSVASKLIVPCLDPPVTLWMSTPVTKILQPREGRKNHDESRVAGLIAVPQYADILENDSDSDEEPAERVSLWLVNSGAAWRKVYTSWAVAARLVEMETDELERNSDDESDTGPSQSVPEPPAPTRAGRWLPCPFSRLFGSVIPQPPARAPRKAFTRQQLLMELLAAEHSDEEPDDGELEGSGDDYDD